MDEGDLHLATDETLMRLLAFAIKHDAHAGDRMKKSPPKSRQDIVNQLHWLGVLSSRTKNDPR